MRTGSCNSGCHFLNANHVPRTLLNALHFLVFNLHNIPSSQVALLPRPLQIRKQVYQMGIDLSIAWLLASRGTGIWMHVCLIPDTVTVNINTQFPFAKIPNWWRNHARIPNNGRHAVENRRGQRVIQTIWVWRLQLGRSITFCQRTAIVSSSGRWCLHRVSLKRVSMGVEGQSAFWKEQGHHTYWHRKKQ
jgi:hypothetical protein